MDDIAVASVLALWAVAGVEVIRWLRRTGTPSLTVSVVALAVGRTIDLELGGPTFGRSVALAVVEHSAVLVSACAVLVFTRTMSTAGDRTGRFLATATNRSLWILAGAALLAPLVNATATLPADQDQRAALYASDPLWCLHWAVFLGALVVVLSQGARIAARGARHTPGVLRARLIGLCLGHTFGVCYAISKGVRLGILATTPTFDDDALAAIEQGSLTACIAAVTLGLLAGPIASAGEGLRTRSQVWRLWPLWVGLWEHAPHLPFKTPPRRTAATLERDSRIVLVRQVVELGDAIRVLGPYMPNHDPADPADLCRALATAAARRSAGISPHGEPGPSGGSSIVERLAFLLPIARHWSQRSADRLVRSIATDRSSVEA